MCVVKSSQRVNVWRWTSKEATLQRRQVHVRWRRQAKVRRRWCSKRGRNAHGDDGQLQRSTKWQVVSGEGQKWCAQWWWWWWWWWSLTGQSVEDAVSCSWSTGQKDWQPLKSPLPGWPPCALAYTSDDNGNTLCRCHRESVSLFGQKLSDLLHKLFSQV